MTTIEGRRNIEIDILIQNLKCVSCSEKIYLCDILEVEIYGRIWVACSEFSVINASVTEVPIGKRDEKGAFNAYNNMTTRKYKPIFFYIKKKR